MDSHVLKLAKKPNHAELEQYLNEQGLEKVTIASPRDFAPA